MLLAKAAVWYYGRVSTGENPEVKKGERQTMENQKQELTIGKKIKNIREGEHMSQEALAGKLHVTRQAISNWERDKTLPDVYMLKRVAQVFGLTLDTFMEDTHKEKIVMGRLPGCLMLASCGTVLLSIVQGAWTNHLNIEVTIMMVIVAVFCQLFLHLYFSSAVKNGDFSMLAGYDSSVEYNVEEVKRILVEMDSHLACSSFGTILLLFLGSYASNRVSEFLSSGVLIVYCVDLTVMILLSNYRGLDRTLVREAERKAAKAGYISVCWFIAWVFVSIGIFIGKLVYFNIENNSKDSIAATGWLLLLMGIATAELFYEQHRVKTEMKKSGSYRLGKMFAVVNALLFLVAAAMCFSA